SRGAARPHLGRRGLTNTKPGRRPGIAYRLTARGVCDWLSGSGGENPPVSPRSNGARRAQHMGKRRLRWLLVGVSVAATAVLATTAYGGGKANPIIIDGTTGTVVNIDPANQYDYD